MRSGVPPDAGKAQESLLEAVVVILAGCGKRGSLLNCPVDGLRNTTMSGHNRSLGHDYIHILGDYYACRCPQDEVDRHQ